MKGQTKNYSSLRTGDIISEAEPGTYRERIVADIMLQFTEEERASYYKLLSALDEAFDATTNVYSITNDTLTCTKEELYELFDKYEAAHLRLKNHVIAQAILDDPRSIRLDEYQEKLTQAYFSRIDESLPGDFSPREIEQTAGDICEYEGQLLKELEANPGKYRGLTIDELIAQEYINDDCTKKEDGLLWALLGTIKRTKHPKKKKGEQQRLLPARPILPAVMIRDRGVDNVEYPIDKINNNIWTSFLTADPNGQLTMFFDTMADTEKKQRLVIYSIDFSSLEDENIVKKLTAYDKRVYIAVNGLYAAGYDIISINQIYAVITNKKTNPRKTDQEKINKSLTKMAARIHLDNRKELSDTYAKYPFFEYDGALLPFDRIKAEVNGNHAEAIRIYRPASEGASEDRALPLVRFAKARGQYTTISTQLFGALSLTDNNLAIEDYLIEQIGHIKRGGINNKMLYETIMKKSGQIKPMQRSRAKEKIHAILDHFTKTGFIKSYTKEADGVTIIYENKKSIENKGKK